MLLAPIPLMLLTLFPGAQLGALPADLDPFRTPTSEIESHDLRCGRGRFQVEIAHRRGAPARLVRFTASSRSVTEAQTQALSSKLAALENVHDIYGVCSPTSLALSFTGVRVGRGDGLEISEEVVLGDQAR